jgi:hypothetical protein
MIQEYRILKTQYCRLCVFDEETAKQGLRSDNKMLIQQVNVVVSELNF